MKFILGILIGSELLFLVLFFSPVFVDKRGATDAFRNWREHSTPETKAAWLFEQRKVEQERTKARATLGVLLVINTAGIVFVSKRIRAKKQ